MGSIFITLTQGCMFDDFHLMCMMGDRQPDSPTMLGNFLAICGAWAAAGYLMIGRKVRKEIPITAYIFCVYSTAAILLIITSIFLGQKLIGFPSQSYLWLFLLGLVPHLIGHSSFNYALGYLPAAFVSVTLVGEPLGTILLAFFLLQEQPGLGELIGGFFILAGIIIISFVNRRQ